MAKLKIKKLHWDRKRFIESGEIVHSKDWYDQYVNLKAKITSDSSYQIVSRKCIIEVNLEDLASRVLLEVIGPLNQNFKNYDYNGGEVLEYGLEKLAPELDFNEILAIAKTIKSSIGVSLSNYVHIVVDEEKLFLHFFNQKDYIRS